MGRLARPIPTFVWCFRYQLDLESLQDTMTFNSFHKNNVRELLLSGVQFRNGITLPGPEALCASQLIRRLLDRHGWELVAVNFNLI